MPTPDRSFPQPLVDAVRNELREFSADDPGIDGLLDRDANRILQALAEQPGVTLPQVEEAEWVLDGDEHNGIVSTTNGDSVECWQSMSTSVETANPELAKRILSHLNGDCTRPYLQLADVVRRYLADGDGDQFDWWPKLGEALMACEETGDGSV